MKFRGNKLIEESKDWKKLNMNVNFDESKAADYSDLRRFHPFKEIIPFSLC